MNNMEDDQDGASITDVTELTADDLETFGLDLEDDDDEEASSQATTSDSDNREGKVTAIQTPLRFHTDGTEARMSVDEDSGKEDGAADQKEQSRSSRRKVRSASPSPIEAFARGAKMGDGTSFPFLSRQHASHQAGRREKGKKRQKCAAGQRTNDSEESPQHWYDQKCFDHYWRHYHFVTAWCQKHMQLYRSVVEEHTRETARQTALKIAQQAAMHSKGSAEGRTPKRTLRNRKARRRRKLAKQRMRQAIAQAERAGSVSSISTTDDGQSQTEEETGDEGEDHTFVMEVTDDMLDFLAHTHRHRLERGM
jgi:hypothetical protein